MTPVVPHRTFGGELPIRLAELHLDGTPRQDLVEDHLRRVDLSDVLGWTVARFQLEVTAPEDEAAAMLDDGLVLEPLVIVSCTRTNLRKAVRPILRAESSEDSEAQWRFVVDLDADEARDKVEVSAEVTADIDDRPARRLGRSATWDIYTDAVARPPFEGTFQVRWSIFTGPGRDPSIPERAASESFFLDLTSSVPQVHLNKDFDGLYPLLAGGDSRAEVGALRDSELRRIATAAWTSAIGAATAAIRVDEDDNHELPPVEWKADILSWCLPVIYPEIPLDEALRKIRTDSMGEDAATTQALIQLAVSQRMQAGRQLARSLGKVTS
ncbi:MAG TPA: hypothetical protein VFY45_17130 [Baekduia sp.]|nr:hypothetical protein [Baekduia sp.]